MIKELIKIIKIAFTPISEKSSVYKDKSRYKIKRYLQRNLRPLKYCRNNKYSNL